MKAMIELQKAVNANDAAKIPAKVAAAQAVAQDQGGPVPDRPSSS